MRCLSDGRVLRVCDVCQMAGCCVYTMMVRWRGVACTQCWSDGGVLRVYNIGQMAGCYVYTMSVRWRGVACTHCWSDAVCIWMHVYNLSSFIVYIYCILLCYIVNEAQACQEFFLSLSPCPLYYIHRSLYLSRC